MCLTVSRRPLPGRVVTPEARHKMSGKAPRSTLSPASPRREARSDHPTATRVPAAPPVLHRTYTVDSPSIHLCMQQRLSNARSRYSQSAAEKRWEGLDSTRMPTYIYGRSTCGFKLHPQALLRRSACG